MKKTLLFVLFIFLFLRSFSQFPIRDSLLSFPAIGVSASYQWPGQDLSDRFGPNTNIGGVFQWKFKNNVIIGLDGQFLFGEKVRESSVLDSLKTGNGQIIAGNGRYADILLSERGLKIELKAGKIFSVFGPNQNSGLVFTAAAGVLQHKIRIESPNGGVPSISNEYAKGYDRLSNGLSLTGFAGYMHFGNSKLVSFYAGMELTQAFTKNRRSFDFDTMQQDLSTRNDLLWGFRFGWLIPIYRQTPKEFYYN